jgi:hypothetical protein
MYLTPVDGVVVLAVYGNEVCMLQCIQQTVMEVTADRQTRSVAKKSEFRRNQGSPMPRRGSQRAVCAPGELNRKSLHRREGGR